MTNATQATHITAPFDSDDHPKSICFGPGSDDIDGTYCDACLRPASEFPAQYRGMIPAAMFQAAIYCADCMPLSYDTSGERVATETGMPVIHSGPDYCLCAKCA